MRRKSSRVVRVSTPLLAAVLLAGLMVPAAAGTGQGKEEPSVEASVTNEQRRIATTDKGIEIELRSSMPFQVRALPPVLRIGDRDFSLSRNPADGRLDTLIFLIPPEEFAKLRPKDRMTVFYALSPARVTEEGERIASVAQPSSPVWDFGTLRKDLLDRPEPADGPEE